MTNTLNAIALLTDAGCTVAYVPSWCKVGMGPYVVTAPDGRTAVRDASGLCDILRGMDPWIRVPSH